MRLCASHLILSEIVRTEAFTLPYLLDRYIEQHLSETITCRALCRALHISLSQLYSLSEKAYHCGVMERVPSRRIEKAQELLSATELEIGRIAEQVSITDGAYFARFFRKRTGLTPTQYRQRFQARP